MTGSSSDRPNHEIVVTRVLEAPRERVWQAWTRAEQVARWWGPEGFRTRVEQLDLRPRGRWRYVMIGPDGAEYPSEGVFTEVVAGERIVSTDDFADDFASAEIAKDDLPRGMVVTTRFEDHGSGTQLSVRMAHPSADDREKHEKMGVVEGWHSMIDCLAEHLRGIEPGDVSAP
jgi:uncharacterized protein YndB with AHSA1/START domain